MGDSFGRMGCARRIRRCQSDRADASQWLGPSDDARSVVGERRLVPLCLSHSGGLRGLETPSTGATAYHAASFGASPDLPAVLRSLGDLRPIAALDVDAVVRPEGDAGGDAGRRLLS